MQLCANCVQPAFVARPAAPSRAAARSKMATRTRITPDRASSVLSGEWDMNWSLATYDDVLFYFANNAIKREHRPSTLLGDIMQRTVVTASPIDALADLRGAFVKYTGLPVVLPDGSLVGVISRRDLEEPGTVVADVMSAPPVAARATDTVSAAACLMLKYKVHRIPVVDKDKRCVGIVTRTDVFTAMAVDTGNEREILNIDM